MLYILDILIFLYLADAFRKFANSYKATVGESTCESQKNGDILAGFVKGNV